MALKAKSLFLYNIQVTTLNRNLDFQAISGGPILTAVLNLGFYSAQGIADELVRAMKNVDVINNYISTVDYSIAGGTQNRISISTSGTFLSLLFGSGPSVNTSCSALIGFNGSDYTGSTTYTGSQSTGTVLVPSRMGYTYNSDLNQAKVFGAVNVSASGLKEAVTFNIQKFIDIDFKWEPSSRLAEWKAFFLWAIQQRPFDFVPEITNPSVAYQVTLESTEEDNKGLAYKMTEMLPLHDLYQTGRLKLRIIVPQSAFSTGS